jgi:RNA polymerase sigma factor (sigma-70 family)
MVVIAGINEKARGKVRDLYESSEVKTRMLSMEQYLRISRQVISKFAIGSVRSQMLRDEDAIAFVAEHLMTATVRYEEGKGRTFKSYLNQCGIWAIQRWLTNVKSADRHGIVSMDFEMCRGDGCGNVGTLHEIIPDETPNAIEAMVSQETVEEILNHPCLNDTQKQCLKFKFLDGMTYGEIGGKINKTRARAEQITKEALRKLHENLEV